MPVLVLEGEEQLLYQCRCDRCGFLDIPQEQVEVAVLGFVRHSTGLYLCEECEQVSVVQENIDTRVERVLERLRQIDSNLDLSPGSMARRLIEDMVRASDDDNDRFWNMATSMQLQLAVPLVETLARPLPFAQLGRSSEPEVIQPLPHWVKEGCLLRRIVDGVVVRVLSVRKYQVTFAVGSNRIGGYSCLSPDPAFDVLFEPVEPKTRWDLLNEEE